MEELFIIYLVLGRLIYGKRLENPFYTGQGRYVMMDRTQTSEGGHHDKNQKTAFTRSEKTVVAKSS